MFSLRAIHEVARFAMDNQGRKEKWYVKFLTKHFSTFSWTLRGKNLTDVLVKEKRCLPFLVACGW
ncbi:MAG: hypothetical protein EA399_03020 [Desulfovibrionales bacterium]|nr:MAG: hypothetical protein EA399_03020 [Desulfovibrionales bacterium]